MAIKKIIDKYAHFVSKNPLLILILVLIVSLICLVYMRNVGMDPLELKNVLPESLDVIKSMNILKDDFGGADIGLIVIELDYNSIDSSEVRDVRDYRVLKYQENLQQAIESIQDVTSSTSSTDIIKLLNGGCLPKTYFEITALTKDNPSFDSYISKDRTIGLIKLTLKDDCDSEELLVSLEKLVTEFRSPSGTKVSVGGSGLEVGVIQDITSSDLSSTASYSMIGILIALLVLTGSIIYGFIPLVTIILGLVWAMGFVGFLGINLNTATSGVISMIMGIGIDFGIQISTRFREEHKKNNVNTAMRLTLESVLYPMLITTLAAVIGFRAMSLGTIKILGEMGEIMSYGVIMCFFVAITAIPSIIILYERLQNKLKNKKRALGG